MTIRKRLTLWYAILLTLIIIAFAAITFGVVRYAMIDNIDNTLIETDAIIRNETRVFDAPMFNQQELQIILPPLDSFQASGIYVQAWGVSEGGPIFKGASDNIERYREPLAPGTIGVDERHISNARFQGIDLRVLTRPITIGGGEIVGYIQVAGDLSAVNEAIEQLLVVMLISCGFAIIGAGLLSMWFSHRALKPIEDITRAAATIALTEDLRTRLDWSGPQDELGRLTSVFNQMMGRIEHMFSVQQRFVADVSHELRTPLTSIQGNLELIRRYGMDDYSMEAMESESKRMTRLVNDLLMLARTDYGGNRIDLFPLDLDTLVLETFEQAQRLVKEREIAFSLEHFEPMRIMGNTDRLKQLFLNLLSNAVKFTEDGGAVHIGLEKVNNNAVFWVKDTGIGIEAKDIERIFDRFYQSDPARTHDGGGFGLGLSIAKWITEAHNGTIRVNSEPGFGTTFSVLFPIYPPIIEENDDLHKRPTRARLPIIRRDSVTVRDTHAPSQHEGSEEDETAHKRKITRDLSIIKRPEKHHGETSGV